jgi:hypothetical protein
MRMTMALVPRWLKHVYSQARHAGNAVGHVAGAFFFQFVLRELVRADDVGGDSRGFLNGK